MVMTENNMMSKVFFRALTLVFVALLASWAVSQPLFADDTEVADNFEGDGMEIPLDGSSMEAWEASMARVKKHSKESTFTSLENSIQYLLVYDLEVKRSMEKLVAKLDGETGYEILARVKWRKPIQGKNKVQTGSEDANIVDSSKN
jgi:hypothetical protein